MMKSRSPTVAALPALANRNRHGYTNNKHEEGLYQVPESQPVPGMMMELRADCADDGAVELRSNQQIIDPSALGDQQKHGEAPEKIERPQPALRGKAKVRIFGSGQCLL